MKPKKVIIIIATLILLTLVSVACSRSQATTPPSNPAPTQETGTTPSTGEPQPTIASGTVPADVPIMPDAYELESPNEFNVIYKVNAPIKDVVAFYQQELPNNGWTVSNNPDTVVGNMAQLSRAKENGDRMTFSLQYNPVGEFTIVQIYLTRMP